MNKVDTMDSGFKKIVQQIIVEHGKEILESNNGFKAILLDCVRGEYKREVRVLTQLLDAGCYRKLCDAKDIALTKQQLELSQQTTQVSKGFPLRLQL
jgi:hypothetical protein